MASLMKPQEIVNQGIVKVGPQDTRFDAALLSAHLDTSERKYVRDAIGSDFYETLKTLRNAATINYNANLGPIVTMFPTEADLENLFINEKLYDLLVYGAICEALPSIHFKVSSTGVNVNTPNYAVSAGANDMRYLQDRYKENIRFLTEEVRNYLCKNSTLFTPFNFDTTLFCDECSNIKTNSKFSTLPIFYS
jgi:hypothetical protein